MSHARSELYGYLHWITLTHNPTVVIGIYVGDWKLEKYSNLMQDFSYILSTFQTVLIRFLEGSECEIVQRVKPFGRHWTLVFN